MLYRVRRVFFVCLLVMLLLIHRGLDINLIKTIAWYCGHDMTWLCMALVVDEAMDIDSII